MRFSEMQTYPYGSEPEAHTEAYLHVRNPRGDRDWIIPIDDDDPLDEDELIRQFFEHAIEFEPESLDTVTRRGVGADLRWTIQLDGRAPFAAVCWSSGGVWTKPVLA